MNVLFRSSLKIIPETDYESIEHMPAKTVRKCIIERTKTVHNKEFYNCCIVLLDFVDFMTENSLFIHEHEQYLHAIRFVKSYTFDRPFEQSIRRRILSLHDSCTVNKDIPLEFQINKKILILRQRLGCSRQDCKGPPVCCRYMKRLGIHYFVRRYFRRRIQRIKREIVNEI